MRTPKATVPEYRVTRCSDGPGYVRIALIRGTPLRDLGFERSAPPEIVLAQQTFQARLELFALEAYAAMLGRAAEHGNRGTLGYFVRFEPIADGTVRVTLHDRWFHGKHLLCEQLASRCFDASLADARAAGIAYVLDLRDQAARRNHQRDAAAARISAENKVTAHGSSDPMPVAEQFAQLLEQL